MNKTTEAFETWWEREGQEFLFALNTTTDEDIKLVAEIAWRNGAYCAEPVKQEPVATVDESAPGLVNWTTWKVPEEGTPLYAEPVDANAIREAARAEALEEAAKVCDDESRYSNYADCCAAAIRRLK